MERNYRIELLDIASDNIDEIAVYIAKDLGNRRAAEKLIEKIYKRIGQLEKFPHANPLYFPPDEEPLRREYRKISLEGYLIFYYVDEDKGWVVISRVICARRDLRRKLEEPEGPVEGGERP